MVWKQTNCYVDLWVELLGGWELDPHAALPFTVTHDFEGDQFTFFKFPLEDLERLYGVVVQEHAIYEPVAVHAANQTARGHVLLVEVDAFYLPDTRGISYRRAHTKTTIGIDVIDMRQARLGYYHNAGYYELDGDDYAGLFGETHPARRSMILAPYVECVKRTREPLAGNALIDASVELLRRHLARRPVSHPVAAFRRALAVDAAVLIERGDEYFHAYSFNTVRQLGANFELLGRYLRWLDQCSRDVHGDAGAGIALPPLAHACQTLAAEAMVLEFRLARAVARGVVDRGEACLDVLEHAYDTVIDGLVNAFGGAADAASLGDDARGMPLSAPPHMPLGMALRAPPRVST
jgi:hypothetical protein